MWVPCGNCNAPAATSSLAFSRIELLCSYCVAAKVPNARTAAVRSPALTRLAPDSGSSVWFVGDIVGCAVGGIGVNRTVGLFVGLFVGLDVGMDVGSFVGEVVGEAVGLLVGVAVGVAVGLFVGIAVGIFVGVVVGMAVGIFDGMYVGRFVGATVKPGGKYVGMIVGTLVGVGVGTCSTSVRGSIALASKPIAAAAVTAFSITFLSASCAS